MNHLDTANEAHDRLAHDHAEFNSNAAHENYMFDTGHQNNRLLDSEVYSTAVKNEKTYTSNEVLTPSHNGEPHFSSKQSRFGNGSAMAMAASNVKSVGHAKVTKNERMSIDTNDGKSLAAGLMINGAS